MRGRGICLLLAVALLFGCCGLVGCRRGMDKQTSSFFLMDTLITVTLYTNDAEAAEAIFTECRVLLGELDALWARQNGTGEVARFNLCAEGVSALDARTVSLLESALAVSRVTDGAFDVTVAPLVELWERCGEADRLPTEAELAAAMETVGYGRLSLSGAVLSKSDARVQIDLGGIGKGAAITHLIEYLSTTGVAGGLVSFGSNVAVFGAKPDGNPYRIAIKDPHDEKGRIGTMTLGAGEVLSVSGDYERFVTIGGARYHHIVDPVTGYPAQSGLSSVAVVCRDGAVADALSTALFVMGEDAAMAFYDSGVYDFEAVFVTATGEVRTTKGMETVFVFE